MPDEVLIPGYGKLLPEQIKNKLHSILSDSLEAVEAENYAAARVLLLETGIVPEFLRILEELQQEEEELD